MSSTFGFYSSLQSFEWGFGFNRVEASNFIWKATADEILYILSPLTPKNKIINKQFKNKQLQKVCQERKWAQCRAINLQTKNASVAINIEAENETKILVWVMRKIPRRAFRYFFGAIGTINYESIALMFSKAYTFELLRMNDAVYTSSINIRRSSFNHVSWAELFSERKGKVKMESLRSQWHHVLWENFLRIAFGIGNSNLF